MDENRVAKYASVQSMAEIGLGSAVHSMHLPLGGHLLSLNQVVCLALATRRSGSRGASSRDAVGIASIVAMLKVLSPAGKRLMPMLAIFVQGLLYSLGLRVAGANSFGAGLGAALLSVWGFLQPLGAAYLLFGKTFFEAAERLWTEAATQLGLNPAIGPSLLLGVVGIKALLAAGVGARAWRADDRFEERYLSSVDRWWAKARAKPMDSGTSSVEGSVGYALRGAVLDLLNPLFLVSLAVCVAFVRGEGWAFAIQTLVWTFVLLFTLRIIPAEALLRWMRRYPSLARAFEQVRSRAPRR